MQYIIILMVTAIISIFLYIEMTIQPKRDSLVENYIKEHDLKVEYELRRNSNYEIETKDKLYKVSFDLKNTFDVGELEVEIFDKTTE